MKGCRPLTLEEVNQVAQSFTGPFALRNHALFLLGLKTGFRISELLSLKVGDVYKQGQIMDWMTVPRQAVKGRTEGRNVPLHPEAKQALQRWLEDYRGQQPLLPTLVLFPSRKGVNKPLTRVQAWQLLQQACQRCGLTGRIGFHSLRKTFGMRVYRALGNDLRGTQEALGHRWITSTQHYLPVDESAITAAILQS